MNESRPSPVWQFFRGLWSLINFTNHLVFNLIMLLFLILVLAGVAASLGAKKGAGAFTAIKDKTALVLDLNGTLVEQYSTDPISRAINEATGDESRELQLRDLLRALEAAKSDKKIERLVLLTDGFNVAGFAALRELGAAVREFRASGKQVVAFGTFMEQKQYYLAAQANEIYLDPEGGVMLEGLGRYRLYYREGLQDKLGVDVHLFRVGEFKSAAEPYILDAASTESREADLFWMGDLWQRYVADVAAARKLGTEQLNATIVGMPERLKAVNGDLARLAVEEKLVDGLKTAYELEQLLSERGARDEDNETFLQTDVRNFLRHSDSQLSPFGDQPQVAVVVAQGEITDGKQPPGTVGGESTAELIRNARLDDKVKALVLRVDSPGGGVFPSEQIRREIALVKEAGKPVVVSMGNVAASGGYWISMNADRIYADESTITGSIGIFGLWMSAPRALEKIGVHADGVGTTPLAGAFDPTRPLDPMVGNVIQSVINHGYAQFIGKVALARGSEPAKIDEVARGRVWSGAQAKERGLVDVLGGLRAATAEAAKLAKLEAGKFRVNYVEREATPFEQFLTDLSGNAQGAALLRQFAPASALIGRDTAARIEGELRWLDRSGRTPYQAVVHCMCGL